jgi:tetratricopeptide (TPR) repeat protein
VESALGLASVFRGGFELEAFAEIVLLGDRFAAMELLRLAHERSLVRVVDVPGSGRRRFFLDDGVRQPVESATRLRHAEWFVKSARSSRHDLGWLRRERDNLLAARETWLELGDHARALEVTCWLEPVFLEEGGATTFLELWDASFRPPLSPELEAEARLARGRAEHAVGELDFARAEWQRAAELARTAGQNEIAVVALLEAARSARLDGALAEAEAYTSEARDLLDHTPEPRLELRLEAERIDLLRDQGRLAEAMELAEAGLGRVLEARERDLREEARARIRVAACARALGESGQADEHDERARELLLELGELVPEADGVDSERSGPRVLIVARNAEWVELVPGTRVDFARRPTLRRLFLALIRARRDRPGQGLSVQALFDAGWPGARIRPESQAARVYVAINSLKKLGFGAVLTRQDDGYLLLPGVTLQGSAAELR